VAFIELRAHTAFSFGDGTCSPEALVARAAALGFPALGLTDHVDLGGLIRFVLAAESAGVKPIAGVELEVEGHPVAFLARNVEGYRNLAALVTRSRVGRIEAWEEGTDDPHQTDNGVPGSRFPGLVPGERQGRPGQRNNALLSVDRGNTSAGSPSSSGTLRSRRTDLHRKYAVPLPERGRPALTFEDVTLHAAGLWCLTGPGSGEIATLVRTERLSEAVYMLDRWRDVFGTRLVVEVQRHHVSGEEAALADALIELAERGRVRWAVANDPRYLDASGRLVHDLLVANRAGVCVNTAACWGLLLPNGEWRLKSPREMAQLWQGREGGLETTLEIADDCAPLDLRWVRPPLPKFPVPAGYDDDSYLKQLAFAGARERWGEVDARQQMQLEHELRVIGRLGFAGFFLVMWDAVRFARSKNILCQGRGSAANSAVAYCLGITAVDPVKHGLLFERFLSDVRTDGRTEAPDIDVDFEMHRREEVLDYMYDNYQRRHAAITAVTQAFHAPTALQDIMRGLGYPAEFAFRFSKRMHRAEPSDGAQMLEEGLAAEYGLDLTDAKGKAVLAAMRVLDDVPRLRSTHPGGFVLSAEPLGRTMPIEHTTMGRTILQFDKDDLDAAGVPKFDFLGLGGLSAVHLAFDAIEKRTGEKLELYRLPVDDECTYEMIARGETVGTFQIESRAQIQSILATRPDRLYDIVVQVALIRPGPIQAKFVHPYTERRRGREEVRYAHPLLEPILRRTYGVPIFQEQAMAVSMALAGFTAGEADELRRAMGHHRKVEKLKAALVRMRDRCIERGISEDVANEVVRDLLSFANYGFPESHAWSFALIAYATAWLKANHPTEFYLGLLNAWPMGFYPPATLVHDARRSGVHVLGPCLRDGEWECTVERKVSGAGFWGGVLVGTENSTGTDNSVGTKNSVPGSRFPGLVPGERQQQWQQQQQNNAELPSVNPGNQPGEPALCPSVPREPALRPSVPGEQALCPPSSVPTRNQPQNSAPETLFLRIGWKHIRGLGESAREALQAARSEKPFLSIGDVVRRAQLTRTDALALARSGAFEAFQPGRRRAAWEALRVAGDLLPLAPARILPFDPRELEGEELIFLDYLATGISTHGHPMEHIRARLDAAGVTPSRDLEKIYPGERIVVAGLVVARQHPETAKGTVFVLLEDEWGFLNVIVPRETFAKNREIVKFSPFLVIEGRFEREDRVMNVIGFRFRELKMGNRRPVNYRSRDFH
jgi:error-prone DNA polymerase